MALSVAELTAQLLQTQAFIDADSVDLSVSRYAVSRVKGGGRRPTGSPTTLTRRARMIPAGEVREIPSSNGTRSEQREWVLLGMPGLDIQEGDEFDYFGPCVVASATPGTYELKARVVHRAV